jgi:Pyruvate/2-oxoacid:ferredoxin oxidoreductase delta subunit
MAADAKQRSIVVGRNILEYPPAKPMTARVKKLGEFPGVSRAHLEVARKLSSPLLNGPPLCDELMTFVQHVFTEEEASVVRHLGQYRGHTAQWIARAERRPVEQVEPILFHLAYVKHVISARGTQFASDLLPNSPESGLPRTGNIVHTGKEQYLLMGVLPGIFEMSLYGESLETMSPWHRRVAELVEALYETGYSSQYAELRKPPGPFVRVLSVGQSIEAHQMALPSDRLEIVMDRYKTFAVGQCQCRMTQKIKGKGCDGPLSVCTVMGEWAEKSIKSGWGREVSKTEALQIKRNAEEHGLVTWIMNVESTKGQCSCSCCPCCCYALRTVNDFNSPAGLAPAHFTPKLDETKCTFCGKCARKCPTHALAVDTAKKTYARDSRRCIGCGLCQVACDKAKAISMEPVPDYKLPYRSWFSMLASSAPRIIKSAWDIKRKR